MTLYRLSNSLRLEDYKCLVAYAQALQPKRVLEFGPGYSTYAWIEAGVPEVISLECRDDWREKKEQEFSNYPTVTVLPFRNTSPQAEVPDDIGKFDLAFVDSPRGQPNRDAEILPGQADYNRLNTLIVACQLSPVVLLHDARRVYERNSLTLMENTMDYQVNYLNFAGSYGIAEVKWPKQEQTLSTKPSET